MFRVPTQAVTELPETHNAQSDYFFFRQSGLLINCHPDFEKGFHSIVFLLNKTSADMYKCRRFIHGL